MAGLSYVVVLAALALNAVSGGASRVPLPPIDLNEYWGPGSPPAAQNTSIWSFKIKYTDKMISDLISRLLNHRPFTAPLEDVNFEYGFNSKQLVRWVEYLTKQYRFKEREAFLNKYDHFMTIIQGLKVHFMRVKSKNKKVLAQTTSKKHQSPQYTPLLLLHGWPGSVREFYDTIPFLIELGEARGIAFDIIVPSIPGFAFSEAPAKVGCGADKIAIIFRNLMHRIGYPQYYINSGDAGTVIAGALATYFPNDVLGLHAACPFFFSTNLISRLFLGNLHPNEITTPDLQNRLYPSLTKIFDIMSGTGYLHIQATKPDTVGVGISDSPVGLMAYIFEKISSFNRALAPTYPDGRLGKEIKPDQLFDNYMLYWITNSIQTSLRLYAETANKRYAKLRINDIGTTAPLWLFQPPDELTYIPAWMLKEQFPNVLGESLPSEGGHFYAWEKPRLFAEDLVKAIVTFKEFHARNSTMYEMCSPYMSDFNCPV